MQLRRAMEIVNTQDNNSNAILHTCEYLEKVHGFEVTYLDVDANGKVDLEQLSEVEK